MNGKGQQRPLLVAPRDIKKGHSAFELKEQRDLFYRAATELISLALDGETRLSLGEALAVLLQTWNREYYWFRKFDAAHYESIERLCCSTTRNTS